jgi:hypothetical protein
MALIVHTTRPNHLLVDFEAALKRERISGWRMEQHDQQTRFYYDGPGIADDACFEVEVESGRLLFRLHLCPEAQHSFFFLSGLYHGRLLEALLSSFYMLIDSVEYQAEAVEQVEAAEPCLHLP